MIIIATCLIISRSVLLRKRNVSDKSCKEIQKHTFHVRQIFSENRAVYEIIRKILEKPDTPQKTIRCMHIPCIDTEGYRRTLRIRNTYCFSTATMVTRTRLFVRLYIHWLSY
jgi:hypothetical protein